MTRPRARWADLALLVVVAGALVDGWRWWQDKPLWLDEQMIAINVRDDGFAGLAGRLTHAQSAPLGWLWSERVVSLVLGDGERALRLLPLLFAVGTLVLAWLIGRRWLGPVGTVVFCALCAVSPSLVRYAAEVKQYSADAFLTLALVGLAAETASRVPYRQAPWDETASRVPSQDGVAERGRPRLVVWWGVAAVASWLSMAAILVAPGIAVVLLGLVWRRQGHWAAVRGALFGLVWLAAVGLHYLVSLRYTTGEPQLKPWWTDHGGFPAADAGLGGGWHWLAGRPAGLAADPLHVPASATAGFWLLVVAGVLVAGWWRRSFGLLLAVPVATGVLLGLARMVPLASRIALWLVPVLLLAVAIAVDAVARAVVARPVWGAVPLTAVAAVGVLMLPAQASAAVARPVAPDRVDDRAAMAWLAARHRPGDFTLVTVSSIPAVRWYGGVRRLAPGRYVRTVAPGPACAPDQLTAVIGGYQRLLVYSGIRTAPSTPQVLALHLAQLGRTVETAHFDAGLLWVVDLVPGRVPGISPVTLAEQPLNCLQLSAFG